jgi:biotin synthase
LGLLNARGLDDPTTAYLMVGERCQRDCSFCAQAHTSFAREDALSRVTWPSFPPDAVLTALTDARSQGRLQRSCLQVTKSSGSLERTIELAHRIGSLTPLSASVHSQDLEDVGALLDAGVDVVGLSLDAANPQAYSSVKGGSWEKAKDLIRRASVRYPGRIATHLIVGLGESEQEMVQTIREMLSWGITVGLFAFTPIPGTAMEDAPPPPLDSYRRIQVAHRLMRRDLDAFDRLGFSPQGQIVDWGMPQTRLRSLLADGQAFRTSGCPGCNRPYYNEHPGGNIYNYPRPLTVEEAMSAVEEALT